MERAFEISKLSGVFQSQSNFDILDSQVVHTVGQDGEGAVTGKCRKRHEMITGGKVSSWYQKQPLEAPSLAVKEMNNSKHDRTHWKGCLMNQGTSSETQNS